MQPHRQLDGYFALSRDCCVDNLYLPANLSQMHVAHCLMSITLLLALGLQLNWLIQGIGHVLSYLLHFFSTFFMLIIGVSLLTYIVFAASDTFYLQESRNFFFYKNSTFPKGFHPYFRGVCISCEWDLNGS
jgi:hypothetical protein